MYFLERKRRSCVLAINRPNQRLSVQFMRFDNSASMKRNKFGCFQFRIYQTFQVSGHEKSAASISSRCGASWSIGTRSFSVIIASSSFFVPELAKNGAAETGPGVPPNPRNSRRTAPLHAPEIRSKIERRQARLLAAKRVVKNAQELRRGIDGDSRLLVRMPRADGALKEMERNGETQNRRSGSRAGVNRCGGGSSVKGSVERIYLRQHHQHHDDEYRKPQQEQPGRGNCPPRHAAYVPPGT